MHLVFLQLFSKLSRRRKWRFVLHDSLEDDFGGLREATASITGEYAYGALRAESGVHRVQRVPATESLGRVHTSTAVVMVLPAVDENAVKTQLHGHVLMPRSSMDSHGRARTLLNACWTCLPMR